VCSRRKMVGIETGDPKGIKGIIDRTRNDL
jgi:hypothetical protein